MKAVLSTVTGGPDALELQEIEDPRAQNGQVVIAVKACGVNYPDVLVIEDRYQFRPERPFSPGGEVAGVIESVGNGVVGLVPGQRVLSLGMFGGMAEKIVVDAERVLPIPDNMPFDEAAAFLVTYETSYYALKERAKLQAGETLLVIGAGGGVGLAAVELGKAFGARVVAAASSQQKLELAYAKGADNGVIYPTGPFNAEVSRQLTSLFKTASGPAGWDVAYDGVGGAYTEAAVRASGWDGRYLVVGFPAGIPSLPLNLTLLKSCSVIGVFLGAALQRDPPLHNAMVEELMSLYQSGLIRPHISEHFPLEKAGDAIALLAQRKARGKIVVMNDG